MKLGIILFFTICLSIQGQNALIDGTISDVENKVIPYASVRLVHTNIYDVTDDDGFFRIEIPRAGNYTLVVNALGFKKKRIDVQIDKNENKTLNIKLETQIDQIGEVIINAETFSSQQNKSELQIESLDAMKVQQQAINTTDLLRRASGVLVRQQGGFGSQVNVNLNGLFGDAVRIYYDGIPLDVYGNAINLNNLPINLIERVEVYKGVMPIQKGTDALGGGINIVSKDIDKDHISFNYEIGSFNTHQLSGIIRKKLNDKITVGTNIIGNYSDNDYLMKDIPNLAIEVEETSSGEQITNITEETVDARRFNDQFASTLLEGIFQVRDLKIVDKLKLSLLYTYTYDEFQHGQIVNSRPAGEAFIENSGVYTRLEMHKQLNQKLKISYKGIYAYANEKVNDSTQNLYDWFGNIQPITNNRGAEILSRPTLRNGFQNSNSHRLTVDYEFDNDHKLTFSNYLDHINIDGKDDAGVRLNIGGESLDPTTFDSNYLRNIAGLQLVSQWLDKDLRSTLFYKNYYYDVDAIDFNQTSGSIIPRRQNDDLNNGFGLGLKYNLSKDFFIRTSYERTTRFPTKDELFGNFLSILSNLDLSPEISDNLNLGFYYQYDFNETNNATLNVNSFFRNQSDLIRLQPLNAGDLAQFINEDKVVAFGLETSLDLNLFSNLSFTGKLTYQNVELRSVDFQQNEAFIGSQIPNIPDFFFNLEMKHSSQNVFMERDHLESYANFFYVDPFSITFVIDENNANLQNVVPAQEQLNIGFTYRLAKTKLSFTTQLNNVFDDQLFDNFRVPKPGINFSFKINYQII